MSTFNLDDFLDKVIEDKDKLSNKNESKGLRKLIMNSRATQGTACILPISCKLDNSFYSLVTPSYEFYGDTSLINSGEGWMQVLPKEFYGTLTEEESALYDEVLSYLKTLKGFDLHYQIYRVRKYTVFFGMLNKFIGSDGKPGLEDEVGKPCIFVYPTTQVMEQFGTAISNKINSMNGNRTWLLDILSPNNTGRKGILQISFNKATGVGYNTQISFELNNEYTQVVDPNLVIPEEEVGYYDSWIKTFLGWRYDFDNDRPFNSIMFRELKSQLQTKIKAGSIEEPTPRPEPKFENKNDLPF